MRTYTLTTECNGAHNENRIQSQPTGMLWKKGAAHLTFDVGDIQAEHGHGGVDPLLRGLREAREARDARDARAAREA